MEESIDRENKFKMKKLNIEARIDNDTEGIGFTINRTPDMSLIEIVGLLEHIKKEVLETMKKKVKIVK